ncbi:unnamed protein product [Candidula unifasciata]|uniref:Translocon-associated protein subunit beta n=1 Tax=Candidula unifasciata TaxID=100452 RepID=A0A8S3YRP7_9EUPU|nr:unnamed protein product [Candidula unifasciata]
MKLWIAALILTFGCFLPSFGEDEVESRILVSKNILNRYAVERKDLTIEYKIYNIGKSAVYGVVLKDHGFPDTAFSTVSGSRQVRWERISPQTNITHVLVVRPLISGHYNFTAAEVSYLTSEEEGSRRFFVSSSFPGEGFIVPQKEFERRFSSHTLDWLVFGIMTLPSLGMPFMLWFKSKNRYDPSKPKSS